MPEQYIVQQGDCVSSIAHERGFPWETIWNHPNNAALRQRREDPNILKEGDVLFIPDKRIMEYTRVTDQSHKFTMTRGLVKLRLRLIEDVLTETSQPTPEPEANGGIIDRHNVVYGSSATTAYEGQERPRANIPFLLEIDGRLIQGRTGGDGMIQTTIPPNAREGRLTLEPGTLRECQMILNLGHLDPVSEISGIKHRLRNLGFASGEINDEETPQLRAALERFQEKNGLQSSGEADQATRDKLRQLHGS